MGKKQEKLCPDLEGPKYGIPFKVVGFQALTEGGNYTDLIETVPNEMITLKNRREYIKWKWNFSKNICDALNNDLHIKWNKIVSIKVQYLLHTEDHFV